MTLTISQGGIRIVDDATKVHTVLQVAKAYVHNG